MNIKLIESAIAAYDDLPADDEARIAFFKGIWEAQAAAVDACEDSYEVPGEDELRAAIAACQPVFHVHGVSIDLKFLAATAKSIAAVICGQEMLNADTQSFLESFDWDKALEDADAELAGSKPQEFAIGFVQSLIDDEVELQTASITMDVLSQALRCQLDKPAAAVNKALKQLRSFEDPKPLTCPCCGGKPALSHVGAKTSSQGRGRVLVCTLCGQDWEFDRIRCACCGDKNATHLHYFSIEGDDAHRIATCDSCGHYMRTLFSEQGELKPISYNVEDVIMARLDAIAADPDFQLKAEMTE